VCIPMLYGKILSHWLKYGRAQVKKAMLKALKWLLIKYGKIEVVQAQEINKVFLFILEYRYVVLSRGMQLSKLTKSKCSLVDLSEI
jgi:hypothetical protein